MSTRAVFFSGAGTIVPNAERWADPSQVRLPSDVAAAIKRLRQAGLKIVMVNSPSTAAAESDRRQLSAIHDRLEKALVEQGAGFDAVYAWPHGREPEVLAEQDRPSGGPTTPVAATLRRAAAELGVDLSACWLIATQAGDVEAGQAAGCRTILIDGARQIHSASPHFAAADLGGAVEIVVRHQPGGPAASAESQGGQDRIESLLTKVVQLLEQQQRSRMYQDFSLAKLAGAVVQMVAIGLFGWGMLATVDGRVDAAFVRLLSAVFMQLLATTLFLLHRHS